MNRWIVYASSFRHRWVAREIVGETDKFWVVQAYRRDMTCDEIPPRRKKKASLGRHVFFDNPQEANDLAKALTDELLAEDERHAEAVKNITAKHIAAKPD